MKIKNYCKFLAFGIGMTMSTFWPSSGVAADELDNELLITARAIEDLEFFRVNL